jgi:small subunit ribosomal protein S9
MADEPQQDEEPVEEPQAEEPAAEEPAVEEPAVEEAQAEEPAAEEPAAEEPQAEAPVAEEKAKEKGKKDGGDEPAAIPGADLEVDIVAEGEAALPGEEDEADEYSEHIEADELSEPEEEVVEEPIVATIALAADARYQATGKRKTAVARVTLKPGKGEYLINGKSLDEFFPRDTLRRTIREPLEAVGYEAKMDVVARMHGGGVSAQADALRHGISRALLEADPGLRGALKSRGFLTRDARAKERKKAGLKKARKRPQFSKR